MGVQYIGDNNPDGVSVGLSASELVSVYGVTPVAQASTVAAATTAVTTALFNSVLTALKNFGVIASS